MRPRWCPPEHRGTGGTNRRPCGDNICFRSLGSFRKGPGGRLPGLPMGSNVLPGGGQAQMRHVA